MLKYCMFTSKCKVAKNPCHKARTFGKDKFT